MAYKKSPLKATRLRKHKRNVRIAAGVAILVLCAVIIFLIWKLIRLPIFMVNQVSVEGNSAIAASDIQAVAMKDMAGSYWYFFPKSGRFWYPQAVIRQDILNDFPTIDSVSLSMQGEVLTVNVQERQAAYIWCDGQMPASGSASMTNDCYFTDSTGYIFAPTTVSAGNTSLLFYGALATSTLNASSTPVSASPIGQNYTTPADFENIIAFVNDLSTLGLAIDNVSSEGSDVYDAYLAAQPGRIIFKATDDPNFLESDISTLKANGGVFSGTSTLDYVDLRFGDKVYYKFVGQ